MTWLTFGLGPRTATTPVTPSPARLWRWPWYLAAWAPVPLRRGPTRFGSTAERAGPDPKRSGVIG